MIRYLLLAAVLLALTPLLGTYLAALFSGKPTWLHPYLSGLEKRLYTLSGVNEKEEMSWVNYTKALLLFNFFGFIFLFLLLLLQGWLPLNPQHFPGVSWPLAFNTAASFVTNTNWQAYSGETTLSYFTQMVGLTTQNFLSAATGLAALLVLIRGLTRKNSPTIGNFWADLVRSTVYLLLPLSVILSFILVTQGVVQTLSSYVEVTTLEGATQTIPLGPVASQVAIKQLGTNGGGFFNANSAHPFENPTPLSNFLEVLAILLIPAALVWMYGLLVDSKRQGMVILASMLILWAVGLFISHLAEYQTNPLFGAGPLLEGKETRFGIENSLIWSVSTTATANGSVNCMLSSLSPLTGAVCLFNIMIGEVIFGGIGVGLCSMLMFVLLTVFLSGLMVGRTPEYLGKKIEKREIQWVMLAVLMPGALILIGAGLSATLPAALENLGNDGPHGLTEILYAFSSAAGNNGSAFAGLNANTTYYNLMLGVVMIIGRLSILLPSLAIGGILAAKKSTPPSLGTFSTNSILFVMLLISVIFIVGALTFFPGLSLGPFVEHLLMLQGRSF